MPWRGSVEWAAISQFEEAVEMADDETTILARAKALAAKDGFTWELSYNAPAGSRSKLRDQHFLSKDRQQDYLERARSSSR